MVDAELEKQAIAAEAAKALAADDEENNDQEPYEPVSVQRPKFDPTDFNIEFDLANPKIFIPAEIQQDLDNDYDLPYTAPIISHE